MSDLLSTVRDLNALLKVHSKVQYHLDRACSYANTTEERLLGLTEKESTSLFAKDMKKGILGEGFVHFRQKKRFPEMSFPFNVWYGWKYGSKEEKKEVDKVFERGLQCAFPWCEERIVQTYEDFGGHECTPRMYKCLTCKWKICDVESFFHICEKQ